MATSPGPWRWAPRYAVPARERPDFNPPDRIVDATGRSVLDPGNVPNRDCDTFDDLLGTPDLSPAEAATNAVLIAAAPELRDALAWALRVLAYSPGAVADREDEQEQHRAARALLERVAGKAG